MMDECDTCMASELRFGIKVGCGAQYIYVIWLLRCGWRHSTEGRMANVHGRAGREPMVLYEGRMANVHGLAGREPMMLLF